MGVTRDGVEFKLGMTLITEGGVEYQTSEEEHEIEIIDLPEQRFNQKTLKVDEIVHKITTIGRKGGSMTTDIRRFYSSQEARIKAQVDGLTEMQRFIAEGIEELRNNGNPTSVFEWLDMMWGKAQTR